MKTLKKFLGVLLCIGVLNFLPNVCGLAVEAYGVNSADLQMGDVDGNGEIMTSDAILVLQYLIGTEFLTEPQTARADINLDGDLTTEDVIMVLRLSADLSSELLQPVTHKNPGSVYNSSAVVKYCRVTEDYAETFLSSVAGDRSNPLCSALPKGTYDRVVKTDDDFVYLQSGMKTYKEEVKVINGYLLPDNSVRHQNIVDYRDDCTDLYFAMDWKVPFIVTLAPQKYETGYSGREFNLVNDTFTARYMDIKFYNTTSADGLCHEYNGSDVIKNSEWIIDSSSKTCTLRIYLEQTGDFYGYKAYYDEKNYLVISVKETPEALDGMVIELDPGHGGEDPGACSGGLRECVIAYDIAQELEKLLVAKGATVIYSYDEKVESVPNIDDRRLTAMDVNPDMYVSIHLNAAESSSAVGSSVYYYKNYSSDLSKSISLALPSAVKSGASYTLQNDGSHFYPFRVARIENCPAVLVECGYITNSAERNMMNSATGKKALARGIYNGIVNYINAQ